ncbi:MAG: sigma-70 family RNA polymerase sigma factor [Bacteroidota bacterium]
MTSLTYQSYKEMLFPIAYNMLGSQSDAEDLVHETLIKWLDWDKSEIENERGYLVRTLINKCLNFIRDRKKENLDLSTEKQDTAVHMPFRVEHDFSLSMSMHQLMAKLNPTERAVFLLKDIFNYTHKEIAEILDISEANCRQILVRARKHLKKSSSRFDVDQDDHQHLYRTFVDVCEGEDLSALLDLLKADIELEVLKPAATTAQTVKGNLQVAETLLAQHRQGLRYKLMFIKDMPYLVAYLYLHPIKYIQLEGNGQEIQRIRIQDLGKVTLTQPAGVPSSMPV